MMLCVCKISGIVWRVESPVKLSIKSCHPIFDMSKGQLITLWEQSGITRKLDSDTIKLLSIALLVKTELCLVGNNSVTFDSYPIAIALKSIPPLIQVLSALANNPAMVQELPLYRIAHYSSIDTIAPSLKNLPDVIEVWREEIAEFQSGYRARHKNTLERLDALSRLINCGTKPIKAAKHLALYVAGATSFPTRNVGTAKGVMNQRDYWIELITLCARITNTEGFNVLLYGTELEDLHAVLEHLQDSGGKGDIYIYQAIALIKRGIASYGDIFAPVMLDSSTISREGQTIALGIQDSIAANMPSTKPDKSAYSSKVDYYKALSAWQLSKGIKQHD